jgi:hypothetical protein
MQASTLFQAIPLSLQPIVLLAASNGCVRFVGLCMVGAVYFNFRSG